MNTKQILDFLFSSKDSLNSYYNHFPFSCPIQIFLIISIYLLTIYKIGPEFMKNRPPYSLKYIVIIYNILQLFFNFYVFVMLLPLWSGLNLFKCPSDTDSIGIQRDRLFKAYYLYSSLKLFDFIETIFFVLRKKNRQISVLHVHHHTVMLIFPYLVGKYCTSIHGVVLGSLNTFVHFVMYFYYLYTASKQQNVWWKKYVTILQIIQHWILFFQYSAIFFNWNCMLVPKWIQGFGLMNHFVVIYLFTKFYIKNYNKSDKNV